MDIGRTVVDRARLEAGGVDGVYYGDREEVTWGVEEEVCEGVGGESC